MVTKSKKNLPSSFEDALAELETIVENMENNRLSLEDSLKSYERGVLLSKICQEKLEQAQQQVQVLQDNLLQPLSFEEEDDEEELPPYLTAPDWESQTSPRTRKTMSSPLEEEDVLF